MIEEEVEATVQTLSKNEKSLLMFMETQAVDYSGRVDLKRMNAEDIAIAEKWNETGFLEFGRICAASSGGYYCHLPLHAAQVAAYLRHSKALRTWKSKNYTTTKELRS